MFTFDPRQLDDMAKRMGEKVPPALQHLRTELEQQFRIILQNGLAALDLVTREEFDAQTRVLARTREKVETLEKQVTVLETLIHTPPTDHSMS